jgi:hypothetical protein
VDQSLAVPRTSLSTPMPRRFRRASNRPQGRNLCLNLRRDGARGLFGTRKSTTPSCGAISKGWGLLTSEQYIKSITQTQKDLQKLSIAVHDLSELYQRHVANSVNIATHYDEIFQNDAPHTLDRLNALLRESNYGITLLYLLLSGEVPGPLWIILKAKDRTHERLEEIEKTFRLPTENRLAGSLRGDFDFFLDATRK